MKNIFMKTMTSFTKQQFTELITSSANLMEMTDEFTLDDHIDYFITYYNAIFNVDESHTWIY